MRMRGRVSQNIFDDSFGQLAAALIFLQHNRDVETGFDLGAFWWVHKVIVSGLPTSLLTGRVSVYGKDIDSS